ncbi:MAG: Mu transposase C-terminal domain-containing protein [Actinobacteria bacterium]|nr:Mu transposase C-terminal domain-containing protein [Actinomycetota bacterium]
MPDAAPGVVLDEERLQDALGRFAVVRSHLQDGVALSVAAAQAGVSARTARRWLARYRSGGLAELARPSRSDRGRRRTPAVLVELIEGLALRRPAPPIAFIHRRVVEVAREHEWPAPSYATVHAVVRALDPGLVVLAHDGPVRYRERYELVYRREANAPNEIWQADHTPLDVLILDEHGRAVRPWLTVIEDDHSRVIAGYIVFVGAPSALQSALALRQAIWRKAHAAWAVCGIPDILYCDHGSDFTSRHIDAVCADLHIRLVHSTAGVPQGRGKLERLFGTITSELLCGLPGWLTPGSAKPATAPALSLAELDGAIGRFLVEDYNQRAHSETKVAPAERWAAGGWLPRMPDSPEQLDMLLLRVARLRVVHRDGIRFEGQRYLALALAGYVGEPVTIRYDPRDLAEIGVYHHDRFVCRAVSPELATQTISLKDLQAARSARRRRLAAQLAGRREHVDELLAATPYPADRVDAVPPTPAAPRARRRLALYREE